MTEQEAQRRGVEGGSGEFFDARERGSSSRSSSSSSSDGKKSGQETFKKAADQESIVNSQNHNEAAGRDRNRRKLHQVFWFWKKK